MNLRQYKTVANYKMITANDLINKDDRTLLYGYTYNRDTWHVYLKDGEIVTVVYGYKRAPARVKVATNGGYMPSKRLYPECCDFEFCNLLKEKGVYLPFAKWDELRTGRRESSVIYYGEILKQNVSFLQGGGGC